MKLSTTAFFSSVFVLATIAVVSSCSRADRIGGAWQSDPKRIEVPYASYASSTVTIDFAPDQTGRRSGDVTLSAIIEIQQPVESSAASATSEPYLAGITATASISGKYMAEEGDDDDLILALDASTMRINVDPDGVSYNADALTGTTQPTLDSLTAATTERWRGILRPVASDVLYSYRRIDDVKVHHGTLLSCEIDDRDQTLRKIQ